MDEGIVPLIPSLFIQLSGNVEMTHWCIDSSLGSVQDYAQVWGYREGCPFHLARDFIFSASGFSGMHRSLTSLRGASDEDSPEVPQSNFRLGLRLWLACVFAVQHVAVPAD
jgi:hypothetical protein